MQNLLQLSLKFSKCDQGLYKTGALRSIGSEHSSKAYLKLLLTCPSVVSRFGCLFHRPPASQMLLLPSFRITFDQLLKPRPPRKLCFRSFSGHLLKSLFHYTALADAVPDPLRDNAPRNLLHTPPRICCSRPILRQGLSSFFHSCPFANISSDRF